MHDDVNVSVVVDGKEVAFIRKVTVVDGVIWAALREHPRNQAVIEAVTDTVSHLEGKAYHIIPVGCGWKLFFKEYLGGSNEEVLVFEVRKAL